MTYSNIGDIPVDELAHYGVKGMKWGVRKDKGHEGEKATSRQIAKADKKYQKSLTGTRGYVKIQNEVADTLNAGLGRLNSNPKYSVDLLDPKNKDTYDSYLKDYEKLFDKSLTAAMGNLGTNASGTKAVSLKRIGEGAESTWEAELKEIQHADGNPIFRLIPKFNTKGKIVSQTIELVVDEGSTAHSDILGMESELAHYGVKGMRWGKRKKSDGGNDSSSKKSAPTDREIKSARRKMNDALDRELDGASLKKKVSVTLLGEASGQLSKDYRAMPERALALRSTTGERAAMILLAGPTGGMSIAVLASNTGQRKLIERDQRKAAGD